MAVHPSFPKSPYAELSPDWQSFRTRPNGELELSTSPHVYPQTGRYTVALKVIDIFGNDTMTLLPVTVG